LTTRPYSTLVHCANCKTWQTGETGFSRWIRANEKLDSGKGYCVTDQDMWVHKFKTDRGRDFQLLMCVETKANGAELTMAQRDTLIVVNALMRNRKQTPTKDLRYQAGNGVAKVQSLGAGKEVYVRCFGMHVLTFSGLGPTDSKWMRWDKKEINEQTLTDLLAFDLDPDTLCALDLRSHHSKAEIPLFDDVP
jgi:hypothetical protein